MAQEPLSQPAVPPSGTTYAPVWLQISLGILSAIVAIIVAVGPCKVPMIRSLFMCEPLLSEPGQPGASMVPTPAPGTVQITMYSSDTKEDWLNAATAAFNAANFKTGQGSTIVAYVEHVKSGSSKDAILAGKIEPTIWSPGEQNWVDELNQVWQDRHNRPLVADPCPPTVYAPVGFAMWRPMAEAMGWPQTPIGWTEIVELAAATEGWAMYGHPEWGQFKFGHTHPDRSNSGLLMLTALAHAVLEQPGSLDAAAVRSDTLIEAMRTVELNTYHYGLNSRDNTTRMVELGPAYLHATNTTEAETLRTNSGVYGEPRFPLVFLFPAEGTFWAGHPFCVLDAEWVSDEQHEAAQLLGDFLQQREQQALAVQYYLRPVSAAIPLTDPLSLENGTDPAVTPLIVPALPSPSPDVTLAIKDLFHLTKKKATILIALDVSGSMEGDKLLNAVDATAEFIAQMERDDEIYLSIFDSTVRPLPPSGRARDVAETLGQTVRGLYAGDGTSLYDAVCTAVEQAEALKDEDEQAGEKRLYGIVVLSDGQDTTSSRTRNEMFGCLPATEEVQGIKVFTIAYGEDADTDLLLRIANRTQGKAFSGDPETISSVYAAIAAEQ